MSPIVRFTIACLCCTAMLGFDASTGVIQGQEEDRTGGSYRNAADAGRGAAMSRDRGLRGRGAPGASNANAGSKKTTVKRFDELIADKNLNKFRGYADESIGDGWKFVGKYLCYDGTGGGDIITKETYTDFELQFKWQITEGGNSGVMYRVSLGDKAPYYSGPEYQLLDDANHADGKNPATSSGALYGLYAPSAMKAKKVGEWNATKIVVEGNKITHYLNSKKVVEAEIGSDEWKKKVGESKFKDWEKFGMNKSGHIAFQDHGDKVLFREIRIKRLNDEAEAVAGKKTESRTAAKSGKRVNRLKKGLPTTGSRKTLMAAPSNLSRGAGPGGKTGNKEDKDDKDDK